jgi:hypothetical protein
MKNTVCRVKKVVHSGGHKQSPGFPETPSFTGFFEVQAIGGGNPSLSASF